MAQGGQPEGEVPRYLANYNRTALALSAAYLLICSIYIVLSDRWVGYLTRSTEEQVLFQTYKGIAFVAFSAALIFAMARKLLQRMAADQRRLREQQQSLIEAERRATAGLMAHAIAHDMNNVLTVGMANVELLRSAAKLDNEAGEMLNDIGFSFERLHDMTRRMSRIGHAADQQPAEKADLMDIARRVVQLAKRHRLADRCAIAVSGPDQLPCLLHVSQMQDILQNLLFNAIEAVNGEGRVEIRVTAGPREHTIEVHDSGPGVPPERRAQIFEAMYSTKPSGMGLGLMSVKAAVKTHRGRVEVAESPLGGACFRVAVPAHL